MWCADICSFECLWKFLSLTEIMMLRLVNHTLYNIVRYNCKLCFHLERVTSKDITMISNRSLFPNLKSFNTFTVSHTLTSLDIGTLMHRWQKWEECTIDTAAHTRKALKLVMLKVKGMRHLKLLIHKKTNTKYLHHLQSAIFCCIRHNSKTLQQIDIKCNVLLEYIIKPISKSSIKYLNVNSHYVSNSNLQMLCASLPSTLEVFEMKTSRVNGIVNNSWQDSVPTFLTNLAKHDNIKILSLGNCISEYAVLCDPMGIISHFCDQTKIQEFRTNYMRIDHIDILAKKRVPKVDTTVVGTCDCVIRNWLTQIPPSYNIHSI